MQLIYLCLFCHMSHYRFNLSCPCVNREKRLVDRNVSSVPATHIKGTFLLSFNVCRHFSFGFEFNKILQHEGNSVKMLLVSLKENEEKSKGKNMFYLQAADTED